MAGSREAGLREGSKYSRLPVGGLHAGPTAPDQFRRAARLHHVRLQPPSHTVAGEELRREQLDYIDWNWDDVRFPAPYPSGGQIEVSQ